MLTAVNLSPAEAPRSAATRYASGMTKRSTASRLGLVLALFGAACGSRTGAVDVGGGPSGVAGSSSGGSGTAGSSGGSSGGGAGRSSGSSSGATGDASSACSTAGLPGPNGYTFVREQDFLDFFRSEALLGDSQSCAVGTTLATCTYDPRTPRTDPSDIHHSDALNRFVGGTGDDYIWLFLPDVEEWLVGDEQYSPAAYALILAYLECLQAEEH